MQENLSKADALETLQAERTRWQTLLTEVGPARMTTPILKSWWSVKDIIAHIAWHEHQTIEVLQPKARLAPARDWLWEMQPDKRNALLYTQFRDKSLADVLADELQAYQQLLDTIKATPDAEQHNHDEFPGMEPNWQPWNLVAAHSYEHYREHAASIRVWLDALKSEQAAQPGVLAGATA